METKKIQDGAFFLSFVVIRYEQREVQSMAFGNNIKKLREEKNLTQQQLADKLYVQDRQSADGKTAQDAWI